MVVIQFAAYFTLAWGIFLFGVILFALQKFGLGYGPITENLISIGLYAVEVTLLSFGLAERINATREKLSTLSNEHSTTKSS